MSLISRPAKSGSRRAIRSDKTPAPCPARFRRCRACPGRCRPCQASGRSRVPLGRLTHRVRDRSDPWCRRTECCPASNTRRSPREALPAQRRSFEDHDDPDVLIEIRSRLSARHRVEVRPQRVREEGVLVLHQPQPEDRPPSSDCAAPAHPDRSSTACSPWCAFGASGFEHRPPPCLDRRARASPQFPAL